jgi:hypothetical protein
MPFPTKPPENRQSGDNAPFGRGPGGRGPGGGQSAGLRPGPLQDIPFTDLLLILAVSLLAQRLLPSLFLDVAEPGQLAGDEPRNSVLFGGLWFLITHSAVLLGTIYIVFIKIRGLRLADLGVVLGTRVWVFRAAVLGILAVPAVIFINVFAQSFSPESFHNPQYDLFASGGLSISLFAASLLIAGILVPIVEEIAFRGLLYGWLRTRMSLAWAIAISSVFFAVLHGIPFLIPALSLVGALLAILKEKSGSALVAAVAHSCFNIINLAIMHAALYYGLFSKSIG